MSMSPLPPFPYLGKRNEHYLPAATWWAKILVAFWFLLENSKLGSESGTGQGQGQEWHHAN